MPIATADVVSGTAIDEALMRLRANVSRATMGLSFTTALMQPFGITQSMVRIGAVPVLRGLARWGGDAARMESWMTWISEKSDFMRQRAKTFNRELREIAGRVQGQSKMSQVIYAGLFYLIAKCQQIADVPTWIGRYEQALAQGLDEATAVAQADQAVAGWLADIALLSVIPAIVPAALTELLRGGGSDDPEKWATKVVEWQAGCLLGLVVGVRELSGLVGGYPYAGPPVGRIVTNVGKAAQQRGGRARSGGGGAAARRCVRHPLGQGGALLQGLEGLERGQCANRGGADGAAAEGLSGPARPYGLWRSRAASRS